MNHENKSNPLARHRQLWSNLVLWYGRVGILLLNTLFLFLFLNILLAVVYLIKDTIAPLPFRPGSLVYSDDLLGRVYPYMGDKERTELLMETWTRPFVPSPIVGFKESVHRGRYVNVDENGFRWNQEKQPWPPKPEALSIFVFGGSTTFGYGVPDAQTIPAILERELQSIMAPKAVHVYNFGCGWYFSAQEQAIFLDLLRNGHSPSLAIFIDGLNEFEKQGRTQPAIPEVQQEISIVYRWPVGRLADSVRRRLKPPSAPIHDEWLEGIPRYPDEARDVVERYLRVVASTEAIARSFQVPVLFVWQPVPEFGYDTSHHLFFKKPVAIRADGYARIQSLIGPGSRFKGVMNLSLLQQGRLENFYLDSHHYTAQFCREIAVSIQKELFRRSLLEASEASGVQSLSR